MKKFVLVRVVALLCAFMLLAPPIMAAEVNLYSARKEALIKPLLEQFTAKTGIDVNLLTGKADALLKRLQSEGRNSPADLLLTTDAGRLHRAKQAGVLQPIRSDKLMDAVPAQYRDPDGYWYGLSIRSRVIFAAKTRVNPGEIDTYEGLADPKWKKRICIRSSNNIYNQSLVASLIAHLGKTETERWARGLVANMARPPQGGDRDQIKAAAAGQCDIAVANTYYYGKMLHAKDEAQRKAANAMTLIWPNQADRGAHVNVSGAGITKSAKHPAAALQLLEFLASPESQAWYAETNFEYPVLKGVPVSDTLKQWGRFKADKLNLAVLGENNPRAVRLMDRAGWK